MYVIPEKEPFIPGEVCFHTEEFAWAEKVASGFHDVDDRATFWLGILESKRGNPAYSVYDNFPKEKGSMKPPPEKAEPLRAWNAEERARIQEGVRACLAAMQSFRSKRSA